MREINAFRHGRVAKHSWPTPRLAAFGTPQRPRPGRNRRRRLDRGLRWTKNGQKMIQRKESLLRYAILWKQIGQFSEDVRPSDASQIKKSLYNAGRGGSGSAGRHFGQ
jgi:hypothetical protein